MSEVVDLVVSTQAENSVFGIRNVVMTFTQMKSNLSRCNFTTSQACVSQHGRLQESFLCVAKC